LSLYLDILDFCFIIFNLFVAIFYLFFNCLVTFAREASIVCYNLYCNCKTKTSEYGYAAWAAINCFYIYINYAFNLSY